MTIPGTSISTLTDDPRCSVNVGGLRLKNPLICGSGEHTITAAGMQALLQAGAAAVVAKSVNESEAARKQLDGTDYVLLDAAWRPLPWDFSPPPDAQLFCRSGLFPGRSEMCIRDSPRTLRGLAADGGRTRPTSRQP